jgi:putative ABC transport system permease protein
LSAGRSRPLDIGDSFEINDREARVVAICRTERHFFGYPYVFTTYDQALQFAPRQRKMLSMILAEPKAGISPESLAAEIQRETGLKAYTTPEFERATIAWIWKNTGIPMSFMTTIILGFVVGVAIAGQTFYSFVLENLRHLGALKAMGASNRLLAGMLLASKLPMMRTVFSGTNEAEALLAGACIIVLLGIADDRWELDALTKMAGQALAAGGNGCGRPRP